MRFLVSVFDRRDPLTLNEHSNSDARLSFRAPALLSFGVRYGYRMLPILVDEFHAIVDGHRVRPAPVRSPGLFGWRYVARVCQITVAAFRARPPQWRGRRSGLGGACTPAGNTCTQKTPA